MSICHKDMEYLTSHFYQASATLFLAAVLLELSKVVYRLYLAPLAGFPGPKLAAATNLYAIYHDAALRGSFLKQLPALHMKYGPIVRITPDELHIKDLECYHKIYKVGTPFDKDRRFYNIGPLRGSLVYIPGTAAATKRRDTYSHHFSKSAIRRADDLIQSKISQLVDTFRAMANENQSIDLSRGYRCLTADILNEYVYHEDFGGISSEEFKHPVIEASGELIGSVQWAKNFVGIFEFFDKVASLIPDRALGYLSPHLLAVREFEANCASKIQKLKQRPPPPPGSASFTLFDSFLAPNQNQGDETPSDSDLTAEAVMMLLAGMDTTANALVVGTWEVLQNEEVYRKLTEELFRAIPNKNSKLSADMLDKLPYLKGVIKESLRLSYGAPGRLPRIVPSSGLTIQGKHIPAGTVISSSIYVYNTDEAVFPEAHKFLPDRWLQENAQELEQKMLSFSRGSRACLGMHLAYAELFLTFARVFRTFALSAFETGPIDMEWGDYGVPLFKSHLKVMMHELST